MDIGKVTVQGLFTGGVHYVVPSFQRRYVWKEDTQWAPLWQDVTDKAIELMKWDDTPPTTRGVEVLPHFLGALVMKQLPTPVGQPIRRLVVDGQQRLTTLQVMTLAIADALMALKEEDMMPELEDAGRDLRNSLINPGRKDASRYQLRPFADRDFECFKQLVDGEELIDDHPLVHCHHYFKSQAIEWMKEDPARKDALINALFRQIMVVGLNLGPDEDEYVIFEALNARGTPLTEWEKSKNHLLSKSRQTSMGEKEYYDRFIARFDDDEWWNEVVAIPRFEGSRAELFLNYWLTVELNQGIQAHHAYYELCGLVKEVDLLKLTDSFCKYACIFRKLVTQPKDHSIQGLFRYRLDVLGITVVMPLMMKLYHMLGSGEPFDRCTKAIECFIIRRQLARWAPSYRRLVIELIKKTSQATESTNVLRTVVDGLTSMSDWPSDTTIERSVRQNSASPGVSSRRLRMILEAIEDHITSGMAAHPKAPRNLWIEHLMPIKWQRFWPLADEADERAHADREHAITTLGNLTLTTAALDIHLRNREWEEKRVELEKHDNLFLNKRLLRKYYEQWNEETIEERGECIANTICEIWPSADRLRREFGLSDGDN